MPSTVGANTIVDVD